MFTRWRLPRLSCRHLIAAYYSCIYPERMKCWVGLVGWPTADGLPTISGHPSAGGRAQDIESSPVKDQRSSVLQPIPWNDRPTHRFAVISTILSSRVSFVVDRGVRNRKKKKRCGERQRRWRRRSNFDSGDVSQEISQYELNDTKTPPADQFCTTPRHVHTCTARVRGRKNISLSEWTLTKSSAARESAVRL